MCVLPSYATMILITKWQRSTCVSETISEDKLVAIWDQFPCLYDIRNRDIRDQAINKIAEKVEQSGYVLIEL